VRVGSLFSGIGGLDLGLERAGMTVRWQCEIDEAAQSVLRRHWPDAVLYDDVTTLGGDVERVGLISGGFPCQDLSVAGRRAGLAGSRSGLFYEFMRVVDELSPRWVLIENVPGLLSSNGGRDMGAVLGTLGELGYGWAYRVLDAQYFGVAQRRRRVFIVGCLGDSARAAQVLFEPESLPGDPPPRREAGTRVTQSLTGCPSSSSCGNPDDNRAQGGFVVPVCGHDTGQGWWNQSDIAGTLRAEGENRPSRPSNIVTHALTAEGHDASEDGTGRGTPLVIAPTLKSAGGSWGSEGPTAIEGLQAMSVSQNQRGELRTSDISPQLTCGGGKPGDGYPAGAYSIRAEQTEGNGCGIQEEATPTLSTTCERGVAVAFRTNQTGAQGPLHSEELADTLAQDHPPCVAFEPGSVARNAGPAGESPQCRTLRSAMGDNQPAVREGMAVRRLTPTECERLQAFPDGWTDGQADSARYRQLGNAVCVNVAEWIGRRIMEAQL
jgi:DNA (cytosine-5)-methyltransferase 1